MASDVLLVPVVCREKKEDSYTKVGQIITIKQRRLSDSHNKRQTYPQLSHLSKVIKLHNKITHRGYHGPHPLDSARN